MNMEKLENLASLQEVLDGVLERNVVVWILIIAWYVQDELAKDAKALFTLSGMVQIYIELGSQGLGQQLHTLTIRNVLVSSVRTSCSIINEYIKYRTERTLKDSRKVCSQFK